MKYTNCFVLACITCLGMTLSGCEEFLERDNPTATTDDRWWVNQSQLNNALNPIYLGLPAGITTYDRHYSNVRTQLSGITDDALFRANYMDFEIFTLGTATSSSSAPLAYYQKYSLIRSASRFLENYQKAYVPDPGLKERYAAEARALRAWLHMELFMLFGPIPIVQQSVEPDGQYLTRSPKEEVINFVVSEMEQAAAVLPAKYNDNEAWRFSKGACYASLSELYLFIGEYAKAAEAAKRVIDLNVYALYKSTADPKNSYANLFQYEAKTNNERVLFVQRGNRQTFRRLAPSSISGQSTISPTASLVDAYETKQGYSLEELGPDSMAIYKKDPHFHDNRDPRLRASVLFPGETFLNKQFDPFTSSSQDLMGQWASTYTGYWVKKWVNATDQSRGTDAGDLDFYIIRYAEVLLNYLEGLVESGDWQHPDIIRYLNDIRNRAGMPNVDQTRYNSLEKIRELVRRERRIELVFEGQRFFDIRRWRTGETALNGPVYGAVHPETGQPLLIERRIFNANRDYLWPIPLNELNANINMVQNEGW